MEGNIASWGQDAKTECWHHVIKYLIRIIIFFVVDKVVLLSKSSGIGLCSAPEGWH